MKNFKITVNNNTYDINVLTFENTKVKVEVNGKPYEVGIEKPEAAGKTPTLVREKASTGGDSTKSTALTSSPTERKGAGVMKAPLPGTIIKVFVKVGDEVKVGTNLLTWEAMKMENNVLAEKAGTIRSVHVKPGDTVLQNDVLVEIE